MTKDEYKETICPSCVNYSYKRNGENCSKFVIMPNNKLICKNYRDWKKCIGKQCNSCGKCD